MKNMRKLFALALALVMVLSLSVTAFAADPETSSITITDSATVKVDGRTFAAYRILDMQKIGDGFVYTVPAGLEDFYAEKFNLDETSGDFDYEVTQAIAAMTSNSTELFDFAKEALAAAKTANITPATATGNGTGDADDVTTSVTINNLPLGYYVVDDTTAHTAEEHKVVSALILDSTTPAKVTIKADLPGFDKNIDGANDTDPNTTELVKYNNTSIGDKVPFVLDSKVPDMIDYKSYTFKVTDTLSKGLTFNDDVAITIGKTTLAKGTDYTVNKTVDEETGETTVVIDFINFIQYKDDPTTETVEGKVGQEIKITYSATVNKDAVIGVVGNPNKVTMTYSNDPDLETSMGKTPEYETRTYVTEVLLEKVNNADDKLADATFTLTGTRVINVLVTTQQYVEDENGTYWKLNDGTYTTVDPTTEGVDSSAYEEGNKKYVLKDVTTFEEKEEDVTLTATTGPDGRIKFTGLGAGTYTIKEIKAPAGYNLLNAPINLEIKWTSPTAVSTAFAKECAWSYVWTADEDDASLISGNTNVLTVQNNAGTELPSTGGMGTTMFYVIGALLVLTSAVLLVTKKRMGAAE